MHAKKAGGRVKCMKVTALEQNYLSDAPVDEDTLFRAIHKHILRQAKAGGRIDTEAEIAERFNVTRYKVRKALAVLSQMGIVDRAPKRGMTVNAMGPKHLSSQIQVQMDIANFDIREFIEARLLIEVNIIPLCVRRMTPALLGRLDDAICRIELNAGNTHEADGNFISFCLNPAATACFRSSRPHSLHTLKKRRRGSRRMIRPSS